MSIERETREYRDGWRTVCKIDIDLWNVTAPLAATRITEAVALLVEDGLREDDMAFDTEVKVYYDGDQDITHTVNGTRPATPQEIRNAQRRAHRADAAHEAALRKQLADIEARRKATP